METRFQCSPRETQQMNTTELRTQYLVEDLIKEDKITLIYSHYDRMIIGGVKPLARKITLENEGELKSEFFLQRREMGVINVGGTGTVSVGTETHELNKLDCIYLGKGTKDISFSSADISQPAVFYILSAPAHAVFPVRKMSKEEASPVKLGEESTSNKRTIYKYIHEDGIESCQLVMGLTVLETGSVWNSVPPHTHTRRMEVYFYFDVPQSQVVFHFMGEPKETRHIVMKNFDAVISPPWSVHFGSGTSNYGFIWGMAGENKAFTDMDPEPVVGLK